ncbi:unnamed protein product [Rhizopus stolonifer]
MKRSRCTGVVDNVAPEPKRRCFGLCPLPSRAKREREDECLLKRPTKFQRVERPKPLVPQAIQANACGAMSMTGSNHATSGESEDDDDTVRGSRQLSGSGHSSDSDDDDQAFLGSSQLSEYGESSDSEEEEKDDDSSVYFTCGSGPDSDYSRPMLGWRDKNVTATGSGDTNADYIGDLMNQSQDISYFALVFKLNYDYSGVQTYFGNDPRIQCVLLKGSVSGG